MVTQSRRTLILTRPEAASARFAAEVEACFGDRLTILSAPLMAPVFCAPELPQGPLAGVIFTSETGVEGLRRLSADRGPAICVGPRTAAAAQAAGWQAEVLGGDAEGLVAALAARRPAGHWLHVRGRDAAGDLGARLRHLGLQITESVVYVQQSLVWGPATHAALQRSHGGIVAVFSPRSGRLFMARIRKPPPSLLVLAISSAAAETVAGLPPLGQEIAPTPDAAGMLAGLGRLLVRFPGA